MLVPQTEHLAHILTFLIQDGYAARALSDRPF
ncbi:hypothetical protein MMMDOFMJ_3982 [Methylobacterium gnaphalii]|nr:hypothetical protein MMMDOFMJ_3982 [Methylobacterium gnaphalii]